MIDTVVLSIPCKREDFNDLNIFTDSLDGIWEAPFRRLPNGYFNTKRNPTSTEKMCNIYVPRLTLIKRVSNGFHTELRIEFSIPKLIYGNNFQEVELLRMYMTIKQKNYEKEMKNYYIKRVFTLKLA